MMPKRKSIEDNVEDNDTPTVTKSRISTSTTSTSSSSSASSSYISTLPKRMQDIVNRLMLDCCSSLLNVDLLVIIVTYVIPSQTLIVVDSHRDDRTGVVECGIRALRSISSPFVITSTSKWSEITTFPASQVRVGFAMCIFDDGDTIMIAGGSTERGIVSSVLQYTLSNEKWTELPPLPKETWLAASANVNDVNSVDPQYVTRWHIIGGRDNNGGTFLDCHYQWNHETKSWTTLSKYPIAASAMSATSYRGSLVVSGGLCNMDGKCSDQVHRFDNVMQTWIPMPSLNHQRYGHTMIAHNDYLFVLCGSSTRQGFKEKTVERYSPKLNTWDIMPWTLPSSVNDSWELSCFLQDDGILVHFCGSVFPDVLSPTRVSKTNIVTETIHYDSTPISVVDSSTSQTIYTNSSLDWIPIQPLPFNMIYSAVSI
jgi:hypothetical protein